MGSEDKQGLVVSVGIHNVTCAKCRHALQAHTEETIQIMERRIEEYQTTVAESRQIMERRIEECQTTVAESRALLQLWQDTRKGGA